jgi:hypothetical protein
MKRKRKNIFCKLSSSLQKRKCINRNFNDSDVVITIITSEKKTETERDTP